MLESESLLAFRGFTSGGDVLSTGFDNELDDDILGSGVGGVLSWTVILSSEFLLKSSIILLGSIRLAFGILCTSSLLYNLTYELLIFTILTYAKIMP